MNNCSEKILKYLAKNFAVNENVKVSLLYNKFVFDKTTIDNSLIFLKNNNMILCNHKQTFVGKKLINLGIDSFCLTSLGKNYFKNKYKEKLIDILRYLLFHIISPIIVACITSIITTNNVIGNNDCCNNTDNYGSSKLNDNSD